MSDPNFAPPPYKIPAKQWREWRKLQRLDGKPGSLPRGRHAKPRGDGDDDPAPREVAAIPVHQRLGFRPAEFAALIGVSYVTVWRGIKSGKIDVVDQNGIKIIPRAYAVKAGYITDTAIPENESPSQCAGQHRQPASAEARRAEASI